MEQLFLISYFQNNFSVYLSQILNIALKNGNSNIKVLT